MAVDIISLIGQTRTVDAYGDMTVAESKKEVYATVKSVGMKEFYQAQAAGLEPEIKFILSDYYDYNGESYIDWTGVRYKVIRTYRTKNELEIVCNREVNKG